MYRNVDIFDQSEFQIGNKAKIVIQQKRINGEYKLDIRVWMKKGPTEQYFPLKSGVCLQNQVIKDQLMPLIDKYLLEYV